MASRPSPAAAAASPSAKSASASPVRSPAAVNDGPESTVNAAIAVDPQVEDEGWSEADTESLRTSSTASLSESITEYRRILGRTYTQKVDYCVPNDEKQNEALDVAHYWETLFLDDRLYLAPLPKSPDRVLDVGTGTGIWAIDFADEFASSEVTGVDISPIQPSWVPPNCKFQIDNVEELWTWPEDYFDFVHIRHLEAAISDWPKLYDQAFRHLAPGGFIEVKELDIEDHSQALGDLPDTHIYKRWAKVTYEATQRIGKPLTHVYGIANELRAAGFVDVVEHCWRIPVGAWPADPKMREVGAVNLEYVDQALEGFGYFLFKEVMGWEDVEIMVFIAEMRKALRDIKLQTFFKLHLIHARKPEAEASSA
ncbi:UMTA [Colletotrichum musicola]|uniref:UMTA n=1 Tax=Colletotrichum musicola TaxID=2175873 RepID=A0A8H6NQF9_9PEZI|nr:UMTA [Colletotrichum musicola]